MGRGISWKRELTQVLGEEETGGHQCDAAEAEASLQFDESMFRYSGSSGSSSAGGLLGNFLEEYVQVLRPDNYHTRKGSMRLLLVSHLRACFCLVSSSSGLNDLDSFDFGDTPEYPNGNGWNYENSLPEVAEISEETDAGELEELPTLNETRILLRGDGPEKALERTQKDDTFDPTGDECLVEKEKPKPKELRSNEELRLRVSALAV